MNVSDNSSSSDEIDWYEYDYSDAIEHYDWAELGPSLVIYSVTFLAGVLGNILILVAVIKSTHVKDSPVNVFLASLASADLLLILICLPLKVGKVTTFCFVVLVCVCVCGEGELDIVLTCESLWCLSYV